MVVCHRDVMERSFHECYSHYESTCKNNLHLNGQQMVVGSQSVFYVGNASIQRKSRYECVYRGILSLPYFSKIYKLSLFSFFFFGFPPFRPCCIYASCFTHTVWVAAW